AAPTFTRKLRKAAVGTGCDIRLRLSVAGFPKPLLTWYHNGEPLPPSEAQDSGGLWIRDCRTSDAGLYTCVATNELGEASCSAVLAVMDLGEDSENTEDETTDPQMETKEGAVPPDEGGGMMDYNTDPSDRRATLPGVYDPVVERELRALGSRPPGLHLDPSNAARQALGGAPSEGAPPVRHLGVEPLIRASHANLARPVQGSEPPPSTHKNSSNSPDQDPRKIGLSRPPSSQTEQASSVASVAMTPKLARAGPKIFDKVLAFEERRASVDLPGGVRSVSASRFGRAASCDLDDSGKKTGGPGKGDERVLQKRAAFKQRASSLEDKMSYSQRVQSKFTEELQRIKKLVVKPSMKKAYSSEQLSPKEKLTTGKLEPIPPQVVKKLEAKERALEDRQAGDGRLQISPQGHSRGLENKKSSTKKTKMTQPNSQGRPVEGSSQGNTEKNSVTIETAPVHQLPGQPLPTATRKSLTRFGPPSPTRKGTSPLTVREPGSQYPPKPPRLAPSPTPSVSPLRVNIPIILVEEEPMETECVANRSNATSKTRRKERRVRNKGTSSDDEGPAGAPRFERTLVDTRASSSSEVTLTCVVTGSPPPTASATRSPLKITREVRDVAVKAGESAMFECHMAGPPDVDVDWLSNGKLIQPALLNCKMHFDGKRCRLLLNSVHEDDSGAYTCKLSTAKATEELTSSANLSVAPSKEPLFTRKLDILEVIEGRTGRFDCKVSGSPAPRVTWTHFETRVEESDDVRILQEGGRHSLVIAHVSADTEGFYTAVAQNIHGKSECTAELYVQEPRAAISSHCKAKLEKMPSIPEEPEVLDSEVEKRTMPDFVKPLADAEVIDGKEALLKCKVAGLPYPTIAWYHNGKRIESSEERKMTQQRDVHSMLIRSACPAHGGVYKAVISNKLGKAACYAHLYVTDIVPDPPDGPPVIEAITGKTITLRWKPPKRLDTFADGSSLLYVVQQQPLGSIQWSVVASNLRETNYTATSLSKGVRYAFRILTSTGKTLSKPSPSTDLVQLLDRGPYLRKAPVILDKPDIVYVVENQPASITITLNHVHAVVTWKRRGVVLVNRPGMHEMSMPDDDQHTLKLQRVRSSDIGQLVVTASNQFGSDLCTLQLAMAVAPKFETIMEDVDVHIGETSSLLVVVEGKPDPDILWFKDDVLLSESNHFTFVYDDPEYSLVVLNARPEHSGVYTSTAKNLAGSNSCKAELTVHKERKQAAEPMEDEGTILRKMRRLTDYYDVHKELGRGAFSYVKRVVQKKGKAEFAAKFISASGKRKTMALKEMDLLSELDNERIVYFQDAFEKKCVVVLITELCHEELLERLAKKTTVKELQIRWSVQQLLEGLRYLHQKNIAHLDVKPENILMASPGSDLIRICDFGNAVKLETSEEHYCRYGTPEYVAPEIVNQTPVSTATDIWPAGVITYLCLTGVSPFAGENDRATALNIRNYNVAFEESMFADLCREAKGFVIKLLVADRLRPSAIECLRHSWFKSPTNKSISTALLKQVLSRRRWQRSLISYKSKMVMRSIPELLNESSNHVSIAVARHLKEGSPPPSSSSDSDADVDELPFIPMPLSMAFSGSRVSLNEIPGEEDVAAWTSVAAEGTRKKDTVGTAGKRGRADEALKNEEETPVEEEMEKTKLVPLEKGTSVEVDGTQPKSRRSTMRRGSSADSALLLLINPEEGTANKDPQDLSRSLKKAVSMELPNRSPSPGAAKLSQEDYALKLELMRQRLLRGGNIDKKMSGLRGPLFETLGMDDERRTASLDRNLRRSRAAPPTLARAASSESTVKDTPTTRVFCKSASFTQGDSEPMPLHRRFGAPLEIPSGRNGDAEGEKLQKESSMSAITEQAPESVSPSKKTSFVLPAPARLDQHQKQNNVKEREMQSMNEKNTDVITQKKTSAQIVIEEEDDAEEEKKENQELHVNEKDMNEEKAHTSKPSSAYASVLQAVSTTTDDTRSTETPPLPEHPAVFAKVATADRPPSSASTSSNPDLAGPARQPVLRTDIKDIDSEEVFQARFKKRESSLTRGLRILTRNKSEEKSPALSRKAGEGGEEVYRPGPRGAPLEMLPKGLLAKSKSVQDLREEERETGLSLIGRFSLRAKRSTSSDKKGEKAKEETPQEVQETAVNKRVSWAIGRSKSLDTKERSRGSWDEREQRKADESSVSAMRRKFESKVAGISAKMRTQSEDRKGRGAGGSQTELVKKELMKVTDSPVLAMRHKFEKKVAGITSKIRSQSEERKEGEEGTRTPLFTRHRHSQSEGLGLKGMGIPENQLAKQSGGGAASKESIESACSAQSGKASESDRRSRWDRWGLTRGKRDKTPSRSDLPASVPKEDFAPVFHIKLRDHVLLEGEPVTLSCLPAGSPHPDITWTMDRKPLELDERIDLMSHPDGRQLLMIRKSSRRDAGVYECIATNPIATITTSCTLTIACVPKRPGTPEVPQTYNNTALVLWKPADTKSPCSYTLERKTEGDSNWLTVATGVVDCYYNVTDLPAGGAFRFRVSCNNKAGQGPYSGSSAPVSLDSTAVPAPPEPAAVPPVKPVQSIAPSASVSTAASSAALPPPLKTPPSLPSDAQLPPAALQDGPKTGSSHPPSAPVKAPPPFVLPKPQSPVNVVSPMTQNATALPPSTTPVKPAVASVPTYAPAARVTPTPVSFSPPVLQSSSMSPFGDGVSTPTRSTPSGRATPSAALRQGVPQKPYTFLEEKARGRFGVVRECRENATGKIYMAKIIPYNQENKQDVLKEYEILKSLHSEKVMALHEAYVTPHCLVLVAEYCTGKELLHSLIDRFRYSEDDVVAYLVQILQGVEYLHNRRVLHLDLKPDNIMVTNLNAVKIVDFGSAQSFNPLSLRARDSAAGTLDYMAPEMVKGEVVGPPADIWTVGVVTYIMLSGRLPFEDKDPLQVESKILMAKFDPSKLYQNVSQSASAFLKKTLSSYPWARPTTRDCFTQAWLQDSYLMKLRRQTLTFTSARLKEFLVERQRRRTEEATEHRMPLRTHRSTGGAPHVP
uniref:non-specific serine/threonine protein kinase n=1 Tax=Gasterosteus aculeatus TaxID=69293 RepID=G3PMQ2_GASAC